MMGYLANRFKVHPNEAVRIALAGCISHVAVETGFHMIDTVNIRSKATPQASSSMLNLMKVIWAKEGVIGFGRGFSAAFYGSVFSGFAYFFLYKIFKMVFSSKFQFDVGIVALMASFLAELITLIIRFPFDLVKCRLQSVNNVFKYKSLAHAFRKEVRNNGFFSLYTGLTPFLMTYCSFVALQFSIYEKLISIEKKRLTPEKFKQKEL
jgi:hypothetical protein